MKGLALLGVIGLGLGAWYLMRGKSTLTSEQSQILTTVIAEEEVSHGPLTDAQIEVLTRTIAVGGEPYICAPEGEPYVDPKVLEIYEEYRKLEPNLLAASTPEHHTGFYPTGATLIYLSSGGEQPAGVTVINQPGVSGYEAAKEAVASGQEVIYLGTPIGTYDPGTGETWTVTGWR